MCYLGKEMFGILDTWPPHPLWPKEGNHMLLQGVPAYQSSVVYKNLWVELCWLLALLVGE